MRHRVRHAQLVVHLMAARIVLAAHKRRVALSRSGRLRKPSAKRAAAEADEGSGGEQWRISL